MDFLIIFSTCSMKCMHWYIIRIIILISIDHTVTIILLHHEQLPMPGPFCESNELHVYVSTAHFLSTIYTCQTVC